MSDKTNEQRLPYRLREPFLSTTERALFHVLKDLMGGRYLICPKVALNELFYIVRPNENVHFFNKFFRKHVDFLLCDLKTISPAFGVEIVRLSGKGETRESDKFMEELFLDAGLPLVHVPSSDRYEATSIVTLFQIAVTKIGGTMPLRIGSSSDTVPNCPVCGKMMVLRINRDSTYSGKKYYGCMDSPRCMGMIPLD
jgi:hypothetical protein